MKRTAREIIKMAEDTALFIEKNNLDEKEIKRIIRAGKNKIRA